jgi:hypothetical protein
MFNWLWGLASDFLYWLLSYLYAGLGWFFTGLTELCKYLLQMLWAWSQPWLQWCVNGIIGWCSGWSFWLSLENSLGAICDSLLACLPAYQFLDNWLGLTYCLSILGFYYTFVALFITVRNILRFIPTMGG